MATIPATKFANRLDGTKIERIIMQFIREANTEGLSASEKATLLLIVTSLRDVLNWRSRL